MTCPLCNESVRLVGSATAFDQEALELCDSLKARTILLVVVQGEKGSGATVATRQVKDREWIIECLRKCALDLENRGTFKERVPS